MIIVSSRSFRTKYLHKAYLKFFEQVHVCHACSKASTYRRNTIISTVHPISVLCCHQFVLFHTYLTKQIANLNVPDSWCLFHSLEISLVYKQGLFILDHEPYCSSRLVLPWSWHPLTCVSGAYPSIGRQHLITSPYAMMRSGLLSGRRFPLFVWDMRVSDVTKHPRSVNRQAHTNSIRKHSHSVDRQAQPTAPVAMPLPV